MIKKAIPVAFVGGKPQTFHLERYQLMSFKLNTVFRNFVVKTKKQRKLKIILKQLAQYYHH